MANTMILHGISDRDTVVKNIGMALNLPSHQVDKVIVVTNESDPVQVKILKSMFGKGCCDGSEAVVTELQGLTVYEKTQNGKTTKLFHFDKKINSFLESVKIAKQEGGIALITNIEYSFSTKYLDRVEELFKDKNIGAAYSSELYDGRIRYAPSFSPSTKYELPLNHVIIRSELLTAQENIPFEAIISAFKQSVVTKITDTTVIK